MKVKGSILNKEYLSKDWIKEYSKDNSYTIREYLNTITTLIEKELKLNGRYSNKFFSFELIPPVQR